jgi:5-methylcytosine-specific restriction endonuclease McrA
MPIKPENRARYPKEWPAIRAAILERAGHACEQCKAPNRTRIARGTGSDAGTYMLDTADVYCADTGRHLGRCRHSDYELARMVDIVLTIAHLDHTPENCDPANLRAWCQRCHLRHDAEHHKANAYATRKARTRSADLFTEAPQ